MKETRTITSRRDKLLELILSLRDKDECRKLGLCWAEGAIAADYALKLRKGAVKSVVLSMEATDKAREAAEKQKVDVRLYTVIYKAIEDMELAMKGLLEPEYREVLLGHAEVRNVFKITGSGIIAGGAARSSIVAGRS